ncbi:hypothetical protein CDAR_169021 [Caerostris darwini]|uniref:Ribosomal protein S14 n=1 Tax=Caerostris darwini TaxID=1538125 RepID=A0AAV4WQK7_9ARAC|nr:hypothetical protein CDAR_169021 [Caerostris darwini]
MAPPNKRRVLRVYDQMSNSKLRRLFLNNAVCRGGRRGVKEKYRLLKNVLFLVRRISFAYIAVICYFRSVIFIEVTVIAMTNTKCGSSTTLDVVPSRAYVLT